MGLEPRAMKDYVFMMFVSIIVPTTEFYRVNHRAARYDYDYMKPSAA